MRLTLERNIRPSTYSVYTDQLFVFHEPGKEENPCFCGTLSSFRHSPRWAFLQNSYCFPRPLGFVSSDCRVLLCHFQGLFETLDHSWCFSQKLTPWRSGLRTLSRLWDIASFPAHRGIPPSSPCWERLRQSQVFLDKVLTTAQTPNGGEHLEVWMEETLACQNYLTLKKGNSEYCFLLWF